ncbi:21574_t:CDS:1, partial [Gigaspora margarita]
MMNWAKPYFRTNIITKLIPFATVIKHQDHKYYFLDLIIALEQELKNVPLKDYEIWYEINKAQVDIGSIMKEVKEHIKEDQDYILSIKADRCKTTEKKLDDMCQEVDENGNIKFYREVLNQCNSFKNSLNLFRPFNEKCGNDYNII